MQRDDRDSTGELDIPYEEAEKSAFQLGKQGVKNNTFLFPSSYPKVGFNRHQGAFNPEKKKMFRIVGAKKTEPIM